MKKVVSLIISIVFIIGCSLMVFGETTDKYILYVNSKQNIVTVYENNGDDGYTPIKAFICSVGNGTPTGSFRTSDKYTWRALFGNVYGQYATRITGHILFHSVPYYTTNKDDLEYTEYNKLGETASMGCIRLTVEDAKWIYDNCPSGTTVKIYESDEKEPIEKPVAMKIDVNDVEKRGWDPTDPDDNNPWKDEIIPENKVSDEPVNINTTKTVKIFIDGREISLESFEDDNSKYYFAPEDISEAFLSAGKNISFRNSGNIVYIKSTAPNEHAKSEKRAYALAESGSIAAVSGSMSTQINIYTLDGDIYFNIEEVSALLGYSYTYINNQLWIKTE